MYDWIESKRGYLTHEAKVALEAGWKYQDDYYKARLSEAERVMEMTYNLMVSECYCDNRDATEYKDIVAAYEAYKATRGSE